MIHIRLILLIIGLVAFPSGPLSAGEGEASPRPSADGGSNPSPAPAEDWTVITCDGNLLMDYLSNKITFFHNVLVKNPRGSIRTDRLILFLSDQSEKVERVEAEGNVRITTGNRLGSSEKSVYYPDEKKAILIGKAMVREGENVVRGEKITFYLDRKEMEVEKGREIEIVPEKDFEIYF